MAGNGKWASIAFAAAAVVAAPASATTYNIGLSTASPPSSTTGGANNGNALIYNVGSGADYLNVRVSAWSINTTVSPNILTDAIVNQYSGGLGVDNRFEPSTSPDHSVDNSSGWIDFVMFQFDRKVDLNSFNIGWVYTGGDADATIQSAELGVAWNVAPNLNNTNISVLNGLIQSSENSDTSTNASGTRTVNVTNQMASTWIISSRNPFNGSTDYFKLKGINVDAPPGVPEPATWMAMITGFGLIGISMRRRREDKSKAGTATVNA